MESKPNYFLIPTDFTEQTYIALEQSYNLARFHNARLLLLNVAEENDAHSRKKLEDMAIKARKESGLVVETMIKRGNIYTEIEKLADAIEPKMIILGLESKIGFDKLIGPNAFRLIRESRYPVLTIRGKVHKKGCENILLPLDLTKETREKVSKALELAKDYGANIRIVSVLSSTKERDENKLMAYSNQVRDYIKKSGVKTSIRTLRGKDVPKMVLNYGYSIDADLLLIMSKAELNLREFFIGTVAQRMINESNIPVLSIRPSLKTVSTSILGS
ncbi:MAG TPA: universal stress protein [Bacteroidia bacterium]|nr:universal stress protein [Bacteroidia bacterium]